MFINAARAICCCRASVRSFSRAWPASTPPSSARPDRGGAVNSPAATVASPMRPHRAEESAERHGMHRSTRPPQVFRQHRRPRRHRSARREGRILGLIGPNGAGKAPSQYHPRLPLPGELRVLGRDPWTERDELTREVASSPTWPCCRAGSASRSCSLHGRRPSALRPRRAEAFLARTSVKRTSKVRELSKGMVTQPTSRW